MNSFGPKAPRNREAGIGVIEIAAVFTLAATIISMALIGFGRAKARYQLRREAQNIVWQIERARTIAIKLNQTLTLAFSSTSRTLDFTCSDCPQARTQLPGIKLPSDVSLSSYPTLSLRGNGTIDAAIGSFTVGDGSGRQVTITINGSGRILLGDVTEQ